MELPAKLPLTRIRAWFSSGAAQRFLRSEAFFYGVLAVAGVVLFTITSIAADAFHRKHRELGEDWFQRGEVELAAGNADRAIENLRNALVYSRDNPGYRLRLAQALVAAERRDEARSYLLNLWEREPGNSIINLELARLGAARGDADAAYRYYHNAIHGVWPSFPERRRREIRRELIELLLRHGAEYQAESEVIALAADLPDDPPAHTEVGRLFLRAGDPGHALAQFRQALQWKADFAPALAGAGEAAFQLGNYRLAENYLQRAVRAGADGGSRELLATARLVQKTDPEQPSLSNAQRARRVEAAFNAALARLEACGLISSPGGSQRTRPGMEPLFARVEDLQPRVRRALLARDEPLRQEVMDLVFNIQRVTARECGQPSGIDLALLLLAQGREGSDQ